MSAKQDKENIRSMYKNMVFLGTLSEHAKEYLVIIYGKKLVESTLRRVAQ